MSMQTSFDRFVETCTKRGHGAKLRPPVNDPGDWRALGASVDPDIAVVHERCDGGLVWRIHVFGRKAVVQETLDRRRGRPYDAFLKDLVLFAKFDGLAYYLATVPALADEAGRQPVVHVDLHEEPVIEPVASSVDGCFALLDEHVSRTKVLPFDEPQAEPYFPESVARSIGSDARLRMLTAREPLKSLLRD